MYIELAPEMENEPNDWVLLDLYNQVVDRDDNLCALLQRNTMEKYLVTKNWFKPLPL